MSNKPLFVGLDVGGSSMKAGVVSDDGQPISQVSLPTEAHRGQDFGLERMCETIRLAIADAGKTLDDVAAVGVATPGTMDLHQGIILDPPNLHPWQNVPVRQYVETELQKPTAFQNDANAAAVGEAWVGAGRSANSLVLFTLGTGVGGGIVLGNQVLLGEHSHGAELGHTCIAMIEGRQCGCGRIGCLEAYASATAVVKRAQEALAEDDGSSSLNDVEEELSARDVFDHASEGDLLAQQLAEETAYYLAIGAVNVMHTINPDVIVFGGGMIAAGEQLLHRIQHHVEQLAFPVPAARTEIRYAELGPDAGFIGAAACGRLLVSS